jgi:hypothetical protein
MLVPIFMVVLSLTVPYPAIRWISIVASALFVVFNFFRGVGVTALEGYGLTETTAGTTRTLPST